MRFYLKTSGTSWLEAVRVIAEKRPALYRRIHAKALAFFHEASLYYHVACNLNSVPAIEKVTDEDLPSYLDQDDARQLIYITYGGILDDSALAAEIFQTLRTYDKVLDRFESEIILKHLSALRYTGAGHRTRTSLVTQRASSCN